MPTLYRTAGSAASHPTIITNPGGGLRLCCCGPPRFDCTDCIETVPDIIQLTLSGFLTASGGGCSSCAAELNTTHNLALIAFGGSICLWRKTGSLSCPSGVTRTYTLTVTFGTSGGDRIISATYSSTNPLGNDSVVWRKTLGPTGDGPFDCGGSHTLNHFANFGGSNCMVVGPVADATVNIP